MVCFPPFWCNFLLFPVLLPISILLQGHLQWTEVEPSPSWASLGKSGRQPSRINVGRAPCSYWLLLAYYKSNYGCKTLSNCQRHLCFFSFFPGRRRSARKRSTLTFCLLETRQVAGLSRRHGMLCIGQVRTTEASNHRGTGLLPVLVCTRALCRSSFWRSAPLWLHVLRAVKTRILTHGADAPWSQLWCLCEGLPLIPHKSAVKLLWKGHGNVLIVFLTCFTRPPPVVRVGRVAGGSDPRPATRAPRPAPRDPRPRAKSATCDPRTPSDPGRPTQPGPQRLTYIAWVIIAISLVNKHKVCFRLPLHVPSPIWCYVLQYFYCLSITS